MKKSDEYTNHYLLYERKVDNPTSEAVIESLLVGVEENNDGAAIAMQVGLSVPIQNIEVQ